MPNARAPRRVLSPRRVILPLVAIAAAVLAVAAVAGASHRTTKRVVAEAQNEALGRTVLTNRKGLTLYSLSVEKHGKFVCTGSCLADWHPLVVAKGVKPTGPVKLGTVERPEGSRQVTFQGRPLYHFDADHRAGEANGEGIRDVGVWHAATPPRQPPPSAPESPGTHPGGY